MIEKAIENGVTVNKEGALDKVIEQCRNKIEKLQLMSQAQQQQS